ncbi:NBR1-Ig-like domain-containing protein [Nonomuraea sp. NPDC050556]|uniref:NBR1-Ig-like domain-containing protein n=1 Tax=Nonomuraea sp. NPDC050556 TaxID=3364369 RepID=UPI0037936919
MDDSRARTETIDDFAATLRDLRNSVGNPPFREMSGRSGAISHTTLHEATKGNRLPSWETTVEFVKACGADPADYREPWERANRAIRSVPDSVPSPSPPKRSRLTRPVIMVAAAVVAVGTAVLVVVNIPGEQSLTPTPPVTASPVALSPADCPVRSSNPPAAPPAHKGDAAMFIEDVTLTDCTPVGAGKTVTKVWRLKNAGTVPWQGYSLRRLDPAQQADQCQTISDVPIADTQPGEMVDIRTDITTPRKPGLCYVRFKMVDASGTVVFPGSRPVNFQIIVGQ